MSQKRGGLFITGTDTDVGKTLVTSLLGALLQAKGYDIGLFKPVQTGVQCPDLEVYRRFVRLTDADDEIVPVRFREPQAPSIAARMEKKDAQIEKMLRTFYILQKRHKNLLIEGVGGILVPIGPKHQVMDLIKEFGLPALVVARPKLGTINHTCLTVLALRRAGIRVAGIVFNNLAPGEKEDFMHVEKEIRRLTRVPVLGCIPSIRPKARPERILANAGIGFDMKRIQTFFVK
ncbi:MAG: dethiobiotin synthase [Fibrobacterota bacterium]